VLFDLRKFIVIISLCLGWSASAQPYQGQSFPELYLKEGLFRHQSGDYQAARHLFESSLEYDKTAESQYYRAISAVSSDDPSGQFYVQEFLRQYPLHALAHQAKFYLAHSFFQEGKYADAALQYGTLKTDALSNDLQEQALFEKGYAFLQLYAEEQGKTALKKAFELKGENQCAAAYYIGVHSEDEEAEKWFLIASEKPEWQVKSAVYLSKIYLNQQAYEKLIDLNLPLISADRTTDNYDLLIYTAEAYYLQEKYRAASRYFNEGLRLGVRTPTAETLFKLGHAYYQTGNAQKAIDALKKSGLNESPTGQASAFQLGKIYTEQNQLSYALNAFEIAASSDHDPAIQEEAWFLSGKINAQLGQFGLAIETLSDFTGKYPDSHHSKEAAELLSTAYLNSSNYDQVIVHFEKNQINSPIIKRNFQKVTYAKGLQAFSDRMVEEAKAYLLKSVQYPQDQQLEKQAHYWLGECYFSLGQVPSARQSYEKALQRDPSYALPSYGLGYLAYNAQRYDLARDHFRDFLKKASRGHTFAPDASLRIADCQYALKNYNAALSAYRALEGTTVPQDYIFYQTGLIEQLQGNTLAAANAYEKVESFQGSPYQDNALFQKAQAFFEDARFEKAEQYFTAYIKRYPDESLAPYAYNKRALGNLNAGNLTAARRDYTYVLDNHLQHPAAKDALLGVQELQKQGLSVDFDTYFAKYQSANPDDESVSTINFEQAKNLYFAQDYVAAIQRFEQVLQNPSSPYKSEATYYLADAHQRTGNLTEANTYYEKVLASGESRFINRTLDKRGKLLIKLERFRQALKNYQQLAETARNRKEKYLAQEGLMKVHFALSNYGSAMQYANDILKAEWKPSNAERQAYLFIGKTHSAQRQHEKAIDAYLNVINASPDALGAEAKYWIAKIQFDQQLHEQSLQTLFQLNSTFGAYKSWVGKSFLLIADNYIELDELLQAKATLQSLIDHFPDEKVKAQAREKMQKIEALKASQVSNDTIR